MYKRFSASLVLAIALGLAGCAETSSRPSGAAPGSAGADAGASGRAAAAKGAPSDRRVHFDFDRSELKKDGAAIAAKWGAYLAANPNVRVTLEGHCDERGTKEYNIGLGERRAVAVRDVLLDKGAAARQISVVSYGEERPLDTAHKESAWKKNRRVEIVIAQ